MPNLDFYAAGSDFEFVVEFIMGAAACRVFESYSIPGAALREFRAPAEVLAALSASSSIGLMVYSPEMRGDIQVRRYEFREKKTSPSSWRETVEGWGLIQLELRAPTATTLRPSHTNHNSRERALKWAPTYPEFPPVEKWDFESVARISRSINHYIRKVSVARSGSRPILPQANSLRETNGVSLAAV